MKNYKKIINISLCVAATSMLFAGCGEIKKENPLVIIPTNLVLDIDNDLTNLELPTGFKLENKNQVFDSYGYKEIYLTYTPENTDKFNKVENIKAKVLVAEIVKSEAELKNAAETNNVAIYFNNDITLSSSTYFNKNVKLYGNKKKINFNSFTAFNIGNADNNVSAEIYDLKFNKSQFSNNSFMIHSYDATTLIVDNCTFGGIEGYGSTVLAAYDTELIVKNSIFNNSNQAVMVKTNDNSIKNASAVFDKNEFNNCGYAIYTFANSIDTETTNIEIKENTFSNCLTNIAKNDAQDVFTIKNNIFNVEDSRETGDKNFKCNAGTLTIDSSNVINGTATTSGNGTVEIK